MPRFHDITGQTFGRLTVLHVSSRTMKQNGNVLRVNYMCECSCGNFIELGKLRLTQGHTRSCGCLSMEHIVSLGKSMRTHGMRHSKPYAAWLNIKNRCLNRRNKHFHYYGGRGITICDKWRNDFAAFYKDVGEPPSPSHSIERIDVNGNYEPGNVIWATALAQSNNQRRIIKYNFFGEMLTIGLAARKFGLRPALVRKRIRVFGWPPEKAVTIPTMREHRP